MTKAAKRSVGTIMQIGMTAISDLSSIGSPSITLEEIDVTTLDSAGGYREFIGGFKDGGEVAISGFFVPADQGQSAVYAALESGDVQPFSIIYPATLGASWSFDGIVTGFNVTAELENAVEFDGTIRVSGKPTLSLSASTGLTALALTGAGGALAPAFSASQYNYAYSGVSAASVTVTATAAGHKLRLYVDDVFRQELTSGQASAAVSLTLNKGTKLTILAQQDGKSQIAYEVVVVKTS